VVAQGADAISQDTSVTPGVGIWAQIEGDHGEFDPETSTTATDYDVSIWRMKAGIDTLLVDTAAGQLIGGAALHYGTISSDISSIFGDASIDATGYGASASLTWYGNTGFYADAQAQVTGYDSDLFSDTAGTGLVKGNDGIGYSLGIELGQRIPVSTEWAVTPQAQLTWSSVDFDDFTDGFGADVSLVNGDALIGRLGLALDRQIERQEADGTTSRAHLYGIGNLYYDFEDGTTVDVAGTPVDSDLNSLWGGFGLGGTYSWADDRYALYGEALTKTSLEDFGDSYVVSGTAGFRLRW
jgi:fibronectin-binding autotransporter adhesin